MNLVEDSKHLVRIDRPEREVVIRILSIVEMKAAQGSEMQQQCRLVEAEECFRDAFWKDVRPIVRGWREGRGLPAEPLQALAKSGYMEQISRERASRNASGASSYA